MKQIYVILAFLGGFILPSNSSKAQLIKSSIALMPPVKAAIDSSKTDSVLLQILQQHLPYFDSSLFNKNVRNVQIVYTQIDRGANGIAAFKTYVLNNDPKKYFYPASAVKLAICLLALQKLNELKQPGLDKFCTMITGQASPNQTPVYNDPTTPEGKPTIAQYIKKILLVSDNDAYNRLYEFLGSGYINEQLVQKGYKSAQILHRLNINLSAVENRVSNPISFYNNSNQVIYQQPMLTDTTTYATRTDAVGKAFYIQDSLVNTAMDFSQKNRISLTDMHNILLSLVFPEKTPAAQRFNLTADDRNFMLKYMSQLPTESTSPPYALDTIHYWPTYAKFLLFGAQKDSLPKNIRSFNKVGDAYGQLTDVAYIVDFEKKVEFALSCTIYCNSDGILNDDKYDYDTIGLPLMQQVGKAVYDYEIARKKINLPDLNPIKFSYDK